LTWGAISAANALVRTPMNFYVLRFLLGLAEAGFAPGMIYYLSLWFPAPLRARYAASYFLAIPLTSVIGGPLSGLVLGMDGALGLHGWQWLFVIEAVPAIVLGIAVYLFLPDGPKEARWLAPDEQRVIEAALAAERVGAHKSVAGIVAALRNTRVLVLAAVYFGIVVGLYGVTLWLPQIIQGMGYSVSATSLIVVAPYAATAVAMIVWARHSDRIQERIWHVAIASAMSAAALLLSAVLSSQLLVLTALSAAAMGICATLAPFWAIPPNFLSGRGAAAGIALINAVGNLGGFVGPYLVGWAKQETGGYAGGTALLALSLIGAAVLILPLWRKARRAPAGSRLV
jgi:ACS family tartrate transporter-like MFS transporter